MQLTTEILERASHDNCDRVVYLVEILAVPQISILSLTYLPESNVFARIVEVVSPEFHDPADDVGSVIIANCSDTRLWPQIGERYLALYYEEFHGKNTVDRYALLKLEP